MRRLAFVALLASACNGVTSLSGIGEPLFVQGATFYPGALPGAQPRATNEAAGLGAQVTDVLAGSALIAPGQAARSFTGHASKNADAVAVRFDGLGTGYWLLPVAGPDPSQEGQPSWSFSADFGDGIPPGAQELRFVAFDKNGHPGDQRAFPVCVAREIPDNLNVCDATRKPPATVVSLSWNSNADLDVVMRTPDGKLVDSKHPTAATTRSGGIPTSELPASNPSTAFIDRDGNGNCAIDARRRENIVWQEPPQGGGVFNVYVNLYSACGASATSFKVTTYQRQANPDGRTWTLVEASSAVGELLSAQANGGAGTALYIASVSF